MKSSPFEIDLLNMYWINNKKDDPNDLCLHGDVYVRIGEEVIADSYSCTVSSTGLYLLKSLENNHIVGEGLNQMLPCCGHFIIPDEKTETVEISGCDIGIDWNVIHLGENVALITSSGNETVVKLKVYREIVYSFVDKIKAFYEKSTPKNIPGDDFEKKGYLMFWKEWRVRRK